MPLQKHELTFFNRQKLDWIFDGISLLVIAGGAAAFFLKMPRIFVFAFVALLSVSFIRMVFLSARFVSLRGRQDGFFARLKWWDPNKGFRLVSSIAFTILWANPKSHETVIVLGLTVKQMALVLFWLHTVWDLLDLKRYLFLDSTGILFAGAKGVSSLKWEEIESIRYDDHKIGFTPKINYKEAVIYHLELRKADDVEWLKQELLQRADMHNIPTEKAEPENAETTQST